jgi:capsular polysaccharide biosynthesis protein
MAHDSRASAAPVNDAVSLRWYFAVLRERWKIVAIGAVVGLLVASAFLALVENSYTARTVVSMTVIGSSPDRPTDAASRLIDISTETEVASSFEVASLASEALDGRLSARAIRDSVDVSTVADATVLVVNFTAPSADAAREGADAVAQGYLDYRSTIADQRIDEAVAFIELRVDELRRELDDLAAELARQDPDSEGELRVETDRSILLESLRTLLGQQFELERIDTSAGRIISPAAENYVEVSPSTSMVLVSGLLGGLLLGAVAAFIVNATSRTVVSQRQLAALLGAQSLGEVSVEDTARTREDVEAADVRGAATRLVGEITDEDNTVVVVDTAGDSTPTVLPFLIAGSVAHGRRPVNVVVAGLSDAERDRVIESLGLTEVRTNLPKPGSGRVARVVHRTVYRMPGSSRVRMVFVPNDGGPSQFEGAVEQAGERPPRNSDDVPPIVWVVVTGDADTDARIMAMRSADAAVIVSRLGATMRHSVEEFVQMSDHFGCRVLGSLIAHESKSGATRHRRRSGDWRRRNEDRYPEDGPEMASAS